MKPRRYAERPKGTRGVQARNVPLGSVCMDRDGYWGVLGKGYVFDRWQVPAVRLEADDWVLLPWATPHRQRVASSSRVHPMERITSTPVDVRP